jgi:hypothetical protein
VAGCNTQFRDRAANAELQGRVRSAVHAIVLDYRSRLEDVIDRAALPHDLPPAMDALKTIGLGETTGPKKPVLLRAFKPMGYDCRGGSGRLHFAVGHRGT